MDKRIEKLKSLEAEAYKQYQDTSRKAIAAQRKWQLTPTGPERQKQSNAYVDAQFAREQAAKNWHNTITQILIAGHCGV